jgi:hypothetical protein
MFLRAHVALRVRAGAAMKKRYPISDYEGCLILLLRGEGYTFAGIGAQIDRRPQVVWNWYQSFLESEAAAREKSRVVTPNVTL